MADRLEEMSIPELLQTLERQHGPGGSISDRIRAVIDLRLAEMQDASARALVASTNGLVSTTSGLVKATWGLVIATGLLVLAEVLLKVFGR